jgi:branched-chain amino acid aminotransferase
VGEICYQDRNYVVAGNKMGELSLKLYNEIMAIQYAEKEDRYRWREKVSL